jgi:Fic family protein
VVTEDSALRSGEVTGNEKRGASEYVLPFLMSDNILVPGEIQNLITWYRNSKVHPLIKSAIFHHEFKFIHPFADGNGRMSRLWHSLLLGNWNEIFFWLPIEKLIRSRQEEYY